MKNMTDITIILDRSGSMSSVLADTIGGFNSFLADQRKLPDEAVLTLIQFDNEYDVIYSMHDIRRAPELTRESYVPRGTTALLDAMGKTIASTGARLAKMPASERPARVIIVTMTDGMENASREFSRTKVFQMVTHQRTKYAWEFVFIGANQDAIATAKDMGVQLASNYVADAIGTASAFDNMSHGLRSYRSGGNYTP